MAGHEIMTEKKSLTEHTYRERITVFFPLYKWLPSYSQEWFRFDLIAGITLAAFAIPELITVLVILGMTCSLFSLVQEVVPGLAGIISGQPVNSQIRCHLELFW